MRRRTLPLLSFAFALALLAIACSSGNSDATPTPTSEPTSTATPSPTSEPTATATPSPTGTPIGSDFGIPEVLAAASGGSIALGEVTYCWSSASGAGLCADKIGIITPLDSLTVINDETISLSGDLDWSGADVLEVNAIARPAAPTDFGVDWLAFRPEGGATKLTLDVTSNGASFSLPSDGAWLVTLAVFEDRGDAMYGLLVERHASDDGQTRTYLGLETVLPFGIPFAVDGTPYELALAAIEGDSRCPVDVTCVWAGETKLALIATSASGSVWLPVTAPNGGDATMEIDSTYRVRLIEVRPEPRSTVELQPGDYSVVVTVERSDAASPGSGARGVVHLGPICPVQRQGFWCPDRALAAELVVRDASGNEVERAESSDDGWFEVSLPPGSYRLEPLTPAGSPFPVGHPIDFKVVTGTWTDLDVAYDSGIR